MDILIAVLDFFNAILAISTRPSGVILFLIPLCALALLGYGIWTGAQQSERRHPVFINQIDSTHRAADTARPANAKTKLAGTHHTK